MSGGAGVVVDLAGSRFTAKLGDGPTLETGVDASVPAAVEAVADGFADLDEQLCLDAFGDPAQLMQRGAGSLGEVSEFSGGTGYADDLTLIAVRVTD